MTTFGKFFKNYLASNFKLMWDWYQGIFLDVVAAAVDDELLELDGTLPGVGELPVVVVWTATFASPGLSV